MNNKRELQHLLKSDAGGRGHIAGGMLKGEIKGVLLEALSEIDEQKATIIKLEALVLKMIRVAKKNNPTAFATDSEEVGC